MWPYFLFANCEPSPQVNSQCFCLRWRRAPASVQLALLPPFHSIPCCVMISHLSPKHLRPPPLSREHMRKSWRKSKSYYLFPAQRPFFFAFTLFLFPPSSTPIAHSGISSQNAGQRHTSNQQILLQPSNPVRYTLTLYQRSFPLRFCRDCPTPTGRKKKGELLCAPLFMP